MTATCRTALPARTSRALALVFACLCLMPKLSHAAEAQTVQTVHSFERTLTKTAGYKYLLALPTGYDRRGERRWPLLLFLHGSGERGDDVRSVAKHGPPKLIETGEPAAVAEELRRSFIVVSPQCPKNKWWDADALLALLDHLAETERVDAARVYLTGLSMGGYGAWELGLGHPERFAALVPICGGGHFPTLFMANTHKRAALRSLPVWAFHGAKDDAVPLAESERMIQALKKNRVADVRLTVYPEARHDSWTETYANPELFAWLLSQVRSARAEEQSP